jgi:hypothetical protein
VVALVTGTQVAATSAAQASTKPSPGTQHVTGCLYPVPGHHYYGAACAKATAGHAACLALVRTNVTPRRRAAHPNAIPAGVGYGPGQLQAAYSLPSSTAGAGQTVAIVDAYNDRLPAGLSINSSTGLISGTPTTAGTSSVTVTAKDTTNAFGTASFTWTIGTTAPCTAAQLLGNPGFETGSAAPWASTAGVINPNGAGETAHTGSWYAWLDGYGTTHTDTLSQTVTIPAACTHTTFSFWLHIDTAETTTTTTFDKLTVTANGTTLVTFSNLNHITGYLQHSYSLGSFAGQTVTLKFTGTEDSSLQTSFVVDDTAVNAS